jgi:hypothetical protein
MPIQVGKALHPELDLGFQCDNTGDNISEKNGSYCELTALYWAWKNLKDVDYIGLCHYRRYFKYDLRNIINDLSKYDVITLSYRNNPFSASMDLSHLLTQEDVAIAINRLLMTHPNYKQSLIQYLYRNNKVSQCNMFIMKWKDFDDYCKFIFPLLADMEKILKPHSYTRLKRNIGYIAENFQGLYFHYKNYKIKYVEKEEVNDKNGSIIRDKIRTIRNNFVFNLMNKASDIQIYDSVKVGLKADKIL